MDKTTKHFAFHREGVDTFSSVLGVVKEAWAVLHHAEDQEWEELRESRPASSVALVSFLGLLGDHVARWRDWTAAVGLLLLSWLQNLEQEQKHEAMLEQQHEKEAAESCYPGLRIVDRITIQLDSLSHDSILIQIILNLNSNFLIQKTYTVHTAVMLIMGHDQQSTVCIMGLF